MSTADLTPLFLIMVALAAIPSSSVALVVVRSATLDVRNGIATAFGIVAGDLVFVVMAIMGLTALSEIMGAFFTLIRYSAAGYLIWFGIGLVRSTTRHQPREMIVSSGGLVTSFVSGLTLTLGDVKAILFYASLFPAFVDLPALSAADIAVILGITLLAVGGVKTLYAFAAKSIARASKGFAYERHIKTATGGLMMGTGGYLILKP